MKIRIEIEADDYCWYASSPDIENFNAFGISLENVRELAEGLVHLYFTDQEISVEDLEITYSATEKSKSGIA